MFPLGSLSLVFINDMRRIIFTILTIGWMVVIFAFSAKDADASTHASNSVGMMIGRVFVADFEEMSLDEQEAFAEAIDHPIRKTAHAMEYAVLGFLVLGAIYSSSMRWYISGLISWLIATVYAASDEFHQLFVPGRSGEVKDVCIDSAGALVGVICGILAFRLINRRASNNK